MRKRLHRIQTVRFSREVTHQAAGARDSAGVVLVVAITGSPLMPMRPPAHKAMARAPQRFTAPESRRLTAQERGYDSRWQAARDAFLAKHPLCVMCHATGRTTAATVVDHIVPHRLGEALKSGNEERIRKARARFWDSSNWQSLCKPHHDGEKQAIDRRSMHPVRGVKSLAGRVF